MNEISKIEQFAVGAITIAAGRDAAIRAEVLKVGDAVRVLVKPSYGEPAVHTGVIVGFEPFKELPTVIIAYVEVGYGKAEMKMLYFNEKSKDTEILPAAPDCMIDIERSRVLDFFDNEETKALAAVDELRAKRSYFEKYFGTIIPQPALEAA